jgi:hypothetical protein
LSYSVVRSKIDRRYGKIMQKHVDEVDVDTAGDMSANAVASAFTTSSVIAGTAGQDAEPPQIVRSGDNVFIIWHEFPTAASTQPDIFLARSANKGATFQPRINLSNTAAGASDQEDIAVTRSGNNTRVYVVWMEDGLLRFRRDKTNDGTFSNPVTLNDTLGNNNATSPQIVASGNNVFVVWQAEHPAAADPTDIFFATSTDSGDSFQDKRNISNNGGNSEAPQLALIADDRVIVTWRDDSGGDFEIYYARSD